MFCHKCGKEIDDEAVVCIHCGVATVNYNKANESNESHFDQNTVEVVNNVASFGNNVAPKNKWVSFLLCLFLGFIGIHKFYEGKIIMGIVYLLTGGLFGIGAIVDLFVILFKPNPYYP